MPAQRDTGGGPQQGRIRHAELGRFSSLFDHVRVSAHAAALFRTKESVNLLCGAPGSAYAPCAVLSAATLQL